MQTSTLNYANICGGGAKKKKRGGGRRGKIGTTHKISASGGT